MQESDGLLRCEKMTEEEWEQETYKAVVAIAALERVMHFGGLVRARTKIKFTIDT
jgi:hypothetical protein